MASASVNLATTTTDEICVVRTSYVFQAQLSFPSQSSELKATGHKSTEQQASCIYTVSQKSIPDIFDCKLKINYPILIIFGTNIPDTTLHQTLIQFPTSSNAFFLHYLGKHNQQNMVQPFTDSHRFK